MAEQSDQLDSIQANAGNNLTLLVGQLQGGFREVKQMLIDQNAQHVRDKEEAISERDRRHEENKTEIRAVRTAMDGTAAITAKNALWIEQKGEPLIGRVSNLEQINNAEAAEKAQIAEGRKIIAAEKRGGWKAWAKIGALFMSLGGLIVLVLENFDALYSLAKRFIWHDGGEVENGKAKAGGALGVTVALIIAFEGIRFVAYKPTPNDVWTICRGHTMGVTQGQTATEAECDRYTEDEATAALAVVDANVTVNLPDEIRGALGDFVYNEGAQAFKSSTMLEKFNSGQTVAACIDLIDWRKQKDGKGGLVTLDGLVKRRKAEMQYCLGVTKA